MRGKSQLERVRTEEKLGTDQMMSVSVRPSSNLSTSCLQSCWWRGCFASSYRIHDMALAVVSWPTNVYISIILLCLGILNRTCLYGHAFYLQTWMCLLHSVSLHHSSSCLPHLWPAARCPKNLGASLLCYCFPSADRTKINTVSIVYFCTSRPLHL